MDPHVQCPKCQFASRDDARFCIQCGTQLEQKCPGCGVSVAPNWNFCGACGASLHAAGGSAAQNVASTAYPIADDARKGEAERRQLTVMFCDLVGSTELAQRLDPEDLHQLNRAYQDACKTAIEHYDGFVARYMGDGVLAYFGYPRAHEDDAERAIHAGLGLVEAMARLSSDMQEKHGIELSTRIGIATGPVVVGDVIGEGASQESAVVGETPNLAARLQTLAAPNTVVIGPGTHSLAGGHFEYEDLGARTLKGMSAPVRSRRVIGPSKVESRFEALHDTTLTPLIGREHEIALLLDRWEQAKEGDGQVVLLAGEAGIGKSRIIQAFRERTVDDEPVRLRYQCSPYHTNSALHPIVEQLRRAAQLADDDPPQSKLDKLDSVLAQSSADIEEVAPLFAALLSIPAGNRYGLREMGADDQKEKTFDAFVAQLEGLSRQRPVLLIFEDAHWADPTSLELLELIVEHIRVTHVLLLMTYRAEFNPGWTGHTHITALSLNRFSRNLVSAMIERVTKGKPLPQEVHQQIVDKTDGVPLFVEELTKTVLESGLVEETAQGYVLTGPLTSLAIPSTLHDSLMARLDRLASIKEVAQTAAAIGREFSYEMLAAISPLDDAALEAALQRLLDTELVFRSGRPPQTSYVFKHALVQDAAYESLLKSTRQQLHARIAETLVESFADTVEAEPGLLAHHYTEAGLSEPAAEYRLKAARCAMERSADREAVAHLKQGLAMLETLPVSGERERMELELQLPLASALTTTMGWGSEESMKVYARARELCERLGESKHLLVVLAGECVKDWVSAEYRASIAAGDRVIELAKQHNRPVELMAGVMLNVWPLLALGATTDVQRSTDKVLEAYDSHEHRVFRFRYGLDLRVEALGIRGYPQWLAGFPDQAICSGADAIAWGRELKHTGSLVWALNWAGAQPAAMRRDPHAAETHTSELLALSDRRRSPMDLGWGRVFSGWAQGKLGQLDKGISLIRDGIESLVCVESMMLRSVHLALLAELYIMAGDLDTASTVLDAAAMHIERREERLWESEIHRLRGEVLRTQQPADGEGAEASFRQAIEVSRKLGAKSLELRAATSLARLWQQDRRRHARALLGPIHDGFTEGFDTPDLRDARTLLESLA